MTAGCARLLSTALQVIKRAHQRSSEFEEALLQARAGVERAQQISSCVKGAATAAAAIQAGDDADAAHRRLLDAWAKAKELLAAASE